MTSIKFQYSPYNLEFSRPFITARGVYTFRKGFIIILSDEKGRKAFGEAAPLPEFGSESYEATEAKLSTLKLNIKLDLADPAKTLEQNLEQFEKLPALKHGIEQALLKLICLQKNISINELLNRESKNEVPVNAAIGYLSPGDTLIKAAELVEKGYTTIKLKGGRDKFSEDLDRVRLLDTEFKDKIKIRIDINGKWDLKEAINNLKRLEHFKIEYAEEPVSGIDQMKELSEHTSIPIAPDETVRCLGDAVKFIDSKISRFIILKPMMMGGLLTVLRIIDYAADKNIIPVITTSLDTAIGRAFAVFAASTVGHNYAHGLGTGIFFNEDISRDPYPVKNGKILIKGNK